MEEEGIYLQNKKMDHKNAQERCYWWSNMTGVMSVFAVFKEGEGYVRSVRCQALSVV